MNKLGDWLEQTDYGYGLGLLCCIGSGVTALTVGFGAPTLLYVLAGALLVLAFVLCWWFG